MNLEIGSAKKRGEREEGMRGGRGRREGMREGMREMGREKRTRNLVGQRGRKTTKIFAFYL